MTSKTPEVLLVAAARVRSIVSLGGTPASVPSWVVLCGGFVILILILWLSDSTDVQFIQHLPSIPGLPIVGNLAQLGDEQPRRLAELAKRYGPVYQIRLGNKVKPSLSRIVKQGEECLTLSSDSLSQTVFNPSSNFGSTINQA